MVSVLERLSLRLGKAEATRDREKRNSRGKVVRLHSADKSWTSGLEKA